MEPRRLFFSRTYTLFAAVFFTAIIVVLSWSLATGRKEIPPPIAWGFICFCTLGLLLATKNGLLPLLRRRPAYILNKTGITCLRKKEPIHWADIEAIDSEYFPGGKGPGHTILKIKIKNVSNYAPIASRWHTRLMHRYCHFRYDSDTDYAIILDNLAGNIDKNAQRFKDFHAHYSR